MDAAKNGSSAFTEVQLAALIAALRMGATMQRACEVAEIPHSTLYYRMGKDAKLQARVDAAKAEADDVVVASLFSRATHDHDTTAMIFWLKNRRPDKWRDRREVSIGDLTSAAKRYAEQLGVDENEVLALAQQLAGGAN